VQQNDRMDRAQAPVAGQGYGSPATVTPNTLSSGVNVGAIPREGFLTAAFVWMFVGLLLSAGSALFVMNNEGALTQVVNNWFVLMIGTFGLVMAINLLITRLPSLVALGLFFVYALLMGLMLGVIVLAYVGTIGISGVVSAFLGASAVFAGAAVYGAVTKRDLTSIGGLLTMGLIGLIVVLVLQMFLFAESGMASFLIGVVGVVLFTGLTAFYVQRIREGQMAGISRESASVVGALALYLAFVNLFIMMLRIFGSNR
jgi:uncharacterized protein